jgi:radical SAM/Cys-rich protein
VAKKPEMLMKSAKTLEFKKHPLASTTHQLANLNSDLAGNIPLFSDKLIAEALFPFQPVSLDTLQVNVGKMCNQTCQHCHVDAGPDRQEIMTKTTIDHCLAALKTGKFTTLDLTGGAPEMNPNFKYFVEEAYGWVNKIIVRSNLTFIVSNKKHHNLPDFFKQYKVEVISSLPCYTAENTDAQRGNGVFKASLQALKMLNAVGYGIEESGLNLHLVYNPLGAFLPGNQQKLEQDYKKHLNEQYGIQFNQLFTITNMPISRFLDYLLSQNKLEDYMNLLVQNYNPLATKEVMCRKMVSVGWDGKMYDCDFNQMLNIEIENPKHIQHFNEHELLNRSIQFNQHCFGCTAGAGSSCTGSMTA